MSNLGLVFALLGAACAAFLTSIGSAKAVSLVGQASAGLLSEEPSMSGKVLPLQLLCGTKGIYGFLTAIFILCKIGVIGSGAETLSLEQGLLYFVASLPVAIGGYFAAVYQGKVAVSSVSMIARQPKLSSKAVSTTSFVELYALLPVVISFVAIYAIG